MWVLNSGRGAVEYHRDMNHSPNLADLRQEYARQTLDEHQVARDPIEQFQRWFDEALRAELKEPNAMVLATADRGGKPAARTVLLKGLDARGLVFFTNYDSRKGEELAVNPQASLLFLWLELERQIRIEGGIEKVAPHESDEYYRSRPLGSRLGAWASPQSRVMPDRAAIEQRFEEAERTHGANPPRPAFWGGYRVLPESFEFWQGRSSRLHDRIRYVKLDAGWHIERLAP